MLKSVLRPARMAVVGLAAAALMLVTALQPAHAASVYYSGACSSFSGNNSWSGQSSFSFSGVITDRCADGHTVKLQMKFNNPWWIGDSGWFNVGNGYCRTWGGSGSTSLPSGCNQGDPWWNSSKHYGLWIRACVMLDNQPDNCGSASYLDNPYY